MCCRVQVSEGIDGYALLNSIVVNLILNAEALRPPITGVGNYTYHLLDEFLRSAYFAEIHAFSGTHWVSGEEQLQVTKRLKLRTDLEESSVKEQLVAKGRLAVGALPGAKDLYSYVMERRFERTANAKFPAVYHETNYILKPYAGPCVTTVHDLSHVRFPHFHPPNVIQWLGDNLAQSLERADCIITVSDVVRSEVLDIFNVAEEKVRTVYEGVDARYQPRDASQTSAVLADLGLQHKQYSLLVATLEPRKGIGILLDAWALLPVALRKAFPLILTGSAGWRNSTLVDRIRSFTEEGTVRHLGYVPAATLPILFSGAAVFCYPSEYEGFGLPVLDAMSSGVPVICRSGTSMAEFSEGACLLCDSAEPEELAAKIEALLESTEQRNAWSEKGLCQAAKFSWARCATETEAIYQLVS